MSAPRILGLSTIHDGWARYHIATVQLPDGTRLEREIEDHGAAVAVLPYDPARRVALLVRQLRTPVLYAAGADTVLEAPAGVLEHEAPVDGARRELFEEVGIRLAALEPAGLTWTMPGISTERMHLFLAAYTSADRTGAGGGLDSEHENIAVEEETLASLAARADAGRLDDMKTLVLVQTLRLRRPDLFG